MKRIISGFDVFEAQPRGDAYTTPAISLKQPQQFFSVSLCVFAFCQAPYDIKSCYLKQRVLRRPSVFLKLWRVGK